MTLTAYRIVKRKHARTAFTGEGARLFGGRWNDPDTAVVYTAGSISLAMLELLVQLDDDEPFDWYTLFPVTFDQADVSVVTAADLPPNWRREPSPERVRAVGAGWAAGGASAVLRVPSAVVPAESNYLFNPAHPRFAAVRIGPRQRLRFDPRLAGRPAGP